ncbi:MAG: 6,7-dimethyl-8-ribityllumazine synthase [Opitutaceae bacterium]
MSLDSPSSRGIGGSRLRFGIAAARFNGALGDALLARVEAGLRAAGVKARAIEVVRVPGSHEVPWAAQALAAKGRFDCVIGLGVLIAGDTNHHEMVGESVSHALQSIALGTRIPVINGVIVVNNLAQARARCAGKIDRGAEFAAAGLAMADLRRRMRA